MENSSGNVWGGHIPVLAEEVEPLLEGDKRVVCKLNGEIEFHAALLSDGNGSYFILVNKERAKKLGIRSGNPVVLELVQDISKYGMPLAEEFEVLLEQDLEGAKIFEQLTPGRQRNLIHIIGKPKSSDIRLRKAVSILEYIKSTQGKIDFKELNEALRVNR